jgi:hypothetical protein
MVVGQDVQGRAMVSKSEWRWVGIWALVIVLVAAVPYVIAYLTAPDGLLFAGFLSNIPDGFTYLAKMRQGWRGEWLFHLPYAPEPHQGAFLFTYYLFLGHLARWVHLPLILVFHLARSINGYLLLVSLYYVSAHFFEDLVQRRLAFLIAALGSGFGWLALFFLDRTVDLWVPEGYVFYSLFANPHFPLAIAAMSLMLLWSVTPWDATRLEGRRLVGVAVCALVLGISQPFVLLTTGTVLIVYTAVRWVRQRRLPYRELASGMAMALGGLPFVINAYLVSITNPTFVAWSEQNLTASPPPWDYAISYGIVLILALFGAWQAVRRRRESDLFLLIWAGCTALLLYAPISLQRRLVMGWIVPLGALAGMGWAAFPAVIRSRRAVVIGFASLTNAFLVVMAVVMGVTHHEALYVPTDEYEALRWMAEGIPQDALVAASPETGLYIPAWSGQRVLYGHPFETPHADLMRAEVEAFLASGDLETLSLRPDYVFWGARERALWQADRPADELWPAVHRVGTVAILAVPQE